MAIVPLNRLVKRLEKKPETTIMLHNAIKNADETLGTFYFTPSIEKYFDVILERVASGKGGGFWIQAEYGAGKTHFLSALGALLTTKKEQIWQAAKSESVQQFSSRFRSKNLFPLVINLKGEADFWDKDNLLGIIERYINEEISRRGLASKVHVTQDDELIDWYEKNKLKEQIDSYIKNKSGKTRNEINKEGLAKYIRQYCEDHSTIPKLSTTTKERIAYVYHQLMQHEFTGLLIIIDEYAAWQDRHPVGTPEYALDEEVLETLAWELPKGRGLEIYTIVASQKPAPAKLRGERFNNFLLLGGKDEKDYDIIVSFRIRDLIRERMPEIEEYYEHYYRYFKFMKEITKEYFIMIFPFQPRFFEVIRKITSRELPTARHAISVAWDTLCDSTLARKALVIASDLMISQDLVEDFNYPAYKAAFEAYSDAMKSIDNIGLDSQDKELAENVIKTLFLWHIAFLETPRPLSEIDLSEATLTEGDIIKGEDEIRLLLNHLREDIPHIEYTKEKGASFKIEQEGKAAKTIFGEIKRPMSDDGQIQRYWEEALKFSLMETGGEESLFAGLEFGVTKSFAVDFRKIEYTGEAIITRDWRSEFGERIQIGSHFRIVFLTRPKKIEISEIKDNRIAVIVASELSGSAKEEARNLWAYYETKKLYEDKTGSEAEKINEWLPGEKKRIIRSMISKQSGYFRDGDIVTQTGIGIDMKRVFSATKEKAQRAVEEVASKLLASAYSEKIIDSEGFRTKFKAGYARNIFEGLLNGNTAASATSACRNFAPALGLSQPSLPTKFRPQENKVFSIIEDKFVESDQSLSLWKVYESLEQGFGLTRELISLFLLCFVARGKPASEIILRPGNRLAIKGNRLSASNIKDVEWRSRIEEDFDLLTKSEPGEIWNNVVEFGRILNTNLKAVTALDEIEEQEAALVQSLDQLGTDIKRVAEALISLASTIGEEIPENSNEIIAFFKELSGSSNYSEFYQRIKDKELGLQDFKNSYEGYLKIRKVADLGTDLVVIRSFLSEVFIPENSDLYIRKNLINSQIQLKTFLENPEMIESIKGQFELFRDAYKKQYQIKHRDFNKSVRELKLTLEDIEPKIEAIINLKKIPELGIGDIGNIPKDYQSFTDAMRPCPALDPVQIGNTPFCRDCPTRVSLDMETPKLQVEDFVRHVERTLASANKRLVRLISKRILIEDKENKLDRLIKAIQASDIEAFVLNLTDELVEYLKVCMAKAEIVTEVVPFFSKVIERFSVVDEESIEEFINTVRTELKKALEDTQKKNPGKKVRLSLRS